MNKHAQTAIEFMILIASLLFFFTVFFLTIQGNMSDKIRERQNNAIKEIALTVQDEINLAYQSIDGYYREFKIPENIGKSYDIQIDEGLVYVKTSDNKHAISFPIQSISVGSDIFKGENIIKKENGVVKLNE